MAGAVAGDDAARAGVLGAAWAGVAEETGRRGVAFRAQAWACGAVVGPESGRATEGTGAGVDENGSRDAWKCERLGCRRRFI